MARLRQYFASRYGSQEATSSEFENVIRYLNAAELGNQTIAELMTKLFDDNGDLNLNIGFEFDPATGLQFRLDSASEWVQIATAEELRGAAGVNMGTIEAPLFGNKQIITSTTAQTVFPYTISSTAADILVWVNGVLQDTSVYTFSSGAGTVTFGVAPVTSSQVTIATIRSNPSASFLRADLTASTSQVSFPFPLTEFDEIIVFRNGIMQREGGGFDYIKSWQSGIITMTTAQTAGTVITIIRISNENIREVAGLMLEDAYCTNGLIRLDKVAIADAALPSAKVNGLDAALATRPSITVAATTPVTPDAGNLWVNTAGSVPFMLFYDGVRWINASPNGLIPSPDVVNSLQFLRLNATATSLEYTDVDLSSVLGVAARGAANGVAPLDSSGLIPSSVIPSWASRSPVTGVRPGSIVNGTISVGLIEDQYTVDGITLALSAGSATVQLSIGGSLVGSTVAVTTTPTRLAIGNISVDGSATPKVVSLVISGATGATDLAYNIGMLLVGN